LESEQVIDTLVLIGSWVGGVPEKAWIGGVKQKGEDAGFWNHMPMLNLVQS
jgi:hypothetical protein